MKVLEGEKIKSDLNGNGDISLRNGAVNIYYANHTGYFWIKNSRGQWAAYNEAACRRELKGLEFSSKAEKGETMSALDSEMLRVQKEHDISFAGELAGYKMGIQEILTNRVLITKGPTLIEPKEGDWSLIRELIEGLFKDSVKDQTPYVYGWIQWAVKAIYSGINTPGQAMFIAGPARCGKSFFQNYIITPILGGRTAKPYSFMTGKTNFNAHLFGAEHLMIEDEIPNTDFKSRQHFATSIKNMCVNAIQECAQKNKTNLSLSPIWRITGSLNDDPIHLLTMPIMDESVGDKIQLWRANTYLKSMPTDTLEERQAYLKKITDQLPAFLWWIQNEFLIPYSLQCPYGSYGVTHYHHPDLVREINDQANDMKLISLIDQELFDTKDPFVQPFVGTSSELEVRLKESSSKVSYEARQLLSFTTACGVYLSSLSKRFPERVQRSRRHNTYGTIWAINPPKSDRVPSH